MTLGKVLVCDKVSDAGLKLLKDAGVEALVQNGLSEAELVDIVRDVDAIIVRSATKITSKIIESAKKLQVIARAGVGVDNIDVDFATKRGVIVVNSPEGNTIAAAEHTLAMMLALSRKIPQADPSLRKGEWNRSAFTGVEVYGKVLGVLGLGKIGSRVAQYGAALGMRVIGSDPFVTPEYAKKIGVELRPYEEIIKEADYITLHIPKTKETHRMFNRELLGKLKKGVRIINCARGGIIDEDALVEAIKSGHVAGAAIDVFEEEPPRKDHPLFQLPQVVVTPHLGAATVEAQVNVAIDVISQVIDVLSGGSARAAVNIPAMRPEIVMPVRPWLPIAEKLGKLAAQLVTGPITAVEVRYLGEVAVHDTSPLSVSVLKGVLAATLQESVNFVNAPVLAKERGIRVIESKSTEITDFANLVSVRVTAASGKHTVDGTLFGTYGERLVRIDGYKLEAVPAGPMLILGNVDKPGMIGQMGTILGKKGINIASMDVGREKIGEEARMVVNVDQKIPPDLVAEIEKINGITWAIAVEL